MIYFDNGATTFPKPPEVIYAVNSAMRDHGANPGRGGHKMSLKASEIIYGCRKKAAELFGAGDPENIIFTVNCTTALNIVIKGLLKKGDHAVISSLEHNAVARPLESMKQSGVSYSIAEVFENDDEATLQSFRNAIKGNTKLVICTAASNVFGVRPPIERIAALCRIYNILFCVDAAQTAGVVPVNMKESGIDFLCTAGHKGLYGPMGTGILAINSNTLPDSLIQGGTGSMSSSLEQPDALPDKYESGTPNLPGIAGLSAGIDFVRRRGVERIFRDETAKARMLYNGLASVKDVTLYTQPPQTDTHAPVVSFNIGGHDSESVAEMLDRRFNIAVRAGLHCAPLAHKAYGTTGQGTVRAVVSAYTRPAQIEYFLNSVKKITKLLPKKVAIKE